MGKPELADDDVRDNKTKAPTGLSSGHSESHISGGSRTSTGMAATNDVVLLDLTTVCM